MKAIASSPLIPSGEDKDFVRPIAVTEVLRRLTASLLLHRLEDRFPIIFGGDNSAVGMVKIDFKMHSMKAIDTGYCEVYDLCYRKCFYLWSHATYPQYPVPLSLHGPNYLLGILPSTVFEEPSR